MKITFDKDKFIDAIKWTYGILNTTKDDAATVRMQVVDKGKVRFSSVSQGNERTIVVDAVIKDPFMITNSSTDEEEYGSIELVASALKKMPSQITSDEVVLTYDTRKSNAAVIADVGLQLRLPIMSSQDWPVTSIDNMLCVGSVSTADLFNTVGLLSVIPTLMTDEMSILYCIDFRPSPDDPDNEMILMAIDGYVMSTRKMAYDKRDGFDGLMIPLPDITAMSDVDKSGSVSIYTDDDSILFSFDDDRTSKIDKINQDPIDDDVYYSFVLKDRDEHFDVKYEDIYDAINRFGSWSKDEFVYMDLVNDSGWTLKIHTAKNSWDSTVPVTNVHINGDEYHVIFSYNMIYKALKTMNQPGVRYWFKRIEGDADSTNTAEYGVVWEQLKTDGEPDDSAYIMSLPEKDALPDED